MDGATDFKFLNFFIYLINRTTKKKCLHLLLVDHFISIRLDFSFFHCFCRLNDLGCYVTTCFFVFVCVCDIKIIIIKDDSFILFCSNNNNNNKNLINL